MSQYVVVKLVPTGERRNFGTRIFGKWAEVKAVNGSVDDDNKQKQGEECNVRGDTDIHYIVLTSKANHVDMTRKRFSPTHAVAQN